MSNRNFHKKPFSCSPGNNARRPNERDTLLSGPIYHHTFLVLHVMRLYYPPLFQSHVDRAPARAVVPELAQAPMFSVALCWSLSQRRRASRSWIQNLGLSPSAFFKETLGLVRVNLLDLIGFQLSWSPVFPSMRFSLLAKPSINILESGAGLFR